MSFAENAFILELYDLLRNVYVYTHMKPYLRDKEREGLKHVIILTIGVSIILLMFLMIFKTFIICLYFLIIQTLSNTVRFILQIPKTKCNIFIGESIKNICRYFGKIFKRMFTYNFYEFDSVCGGIFFVCVFFVYLVSNALFMLYVFNEIDQENKSNKFIITHFIVFESNILLQLICITFYNVRRINKQIGIVLGYFVFVNSAVLLTFYGKRIWINEVGVIEGHIPRRIINLVLNVVFCLMNVTNLVNIIRYDVNKQAFLALFSERQLPSSSHTHTHTHTNALSNVDDKIISVSKKYHLKKLYYGKDKHNIFKRKDRFQHKTLLILLFSLLIITELYEIIYNTVQIVYITDSSDSIKWVMVTKNIRTMIHEVTFLLMSCMLFIKFKIQTTIYY